MAEQYQKSLGAWIPTFILDDSDLNPVDKLLYAIIFNLCNERGYCWASNEYLAKRIAVGPATITRSINNLKKKGVIIDFYEVNEKGRFRRLKIDHSISGGGHQNDEGVSSKRLGGSHQNDEHKKTVISKTVEDISMLASQAMEVFDEIKAKYPNGQKLIKLSISKKRISLVKSRYKEFKISWPEADFIKSLRFVVEYKAKEWNGTEYWKFLKPETVLSETHFIDYCEQAKSNNGNPPIATKKSTAAPSIAVPVFRKQGTDNEDTLRILDQRKAEAEAKRQQNIQ